MNNSSAVPSENKSSIMFVKPKIKIRQKIKNDLILAIGFMILFAANNTQIRIQKLINSSIRRDNPEYTVDGFVVYGILFSVQSITVWLTPAIVHYCGLKISMIIGAAGSIPVATFFCFENNNLTYLSAVIGGFTHGLLWCAQGVYTVMNSDVGNVYSSVSIFTFIFWFSQILGNGVLYFQFTDSSQFLDRETRIKIALVLLTFVLLSTFILSFLPPATRDKKQTSVPTCSELLNQVKLAFVIMFTKKMSVACIIFGYIGANVTFANVVGTSMGFSKFLSSNSKIYSTIAGIFQGAGDIFGSASAFYLKDQRFLSRAPILTLGCIASIVGLNLIYVGLPDKSVFSYTNELPIMRIPVILLLLANFLIGFTDASLHIEAYNYIGTLYPYNSAPAFAVFKFIRYSTVAFSFYCGNWFGLHAQTRILFALNLFSLAAYFYTTRKPRIAQDQQLHASAFSVNQLLEESLSPAESK